MNENAEGAVVGTLSSFDPDAGDSVEYTVSDDRFEVVDGELRLAEGVSLNHEEADSIDVTVTATDSEGLSTSEDFTIEVADVNEAPTDLSLNGEQGVLSLNQNGDGDDLAISSDVTDFPSDAITVEVTFTADGMPEGSGAPLFSYADSSGGGGNDVLIWGENSTGNLAIFLDGQRFRTDISNSDLFDGEEHTVSFTWDDASGELNVYVDGDLEYSQDVNVSGIDTDGTITLGQEQDSEGGSFDSGQIFQGEIAEVRIYEDALTEEQVADNATGELTQDGLVTHWDMAEAENGVVSDLAGNNDLVLENGAEITQVAGDATGSIAENAEGAVIGTVSSFDPDEGDSVAYAVSDDRFEVVDGELRLAESVSLDYETEQSVDVTVTATDNAGLETSETFTINVADIDDGPVVTMSQKTVTEAAEVDNAEITTSNGGGSETSTVSLSDAVDGSSEIVIDFGRIDNSFEVEVNGQSLTDEIIQLQPNVFDDASEVMLVFEDGTVASTPWVPNSDGSPRFQVVVSDDGVEILGTRGPNSGDLEPMTLDGAEFNTVDLLEGDNSVTVINPDGDGPDGLDATVSAEFETVVDVQTVTGTDADDTLVSSDADDVLIGGDGDDLFIFDGGSGADTVDGGSGWTDTLDLSAATDNGMVYGDDWTVTLTEGAIVAEDADMITLTDDAAGLIEFENGDTLDFQNIDQIGF